MKKNFTVIIVYFVSLLLSKGSLLNGQSLSLSAQDKKNIELQREAEKNTAINTNVISNLSSINLTSLFNDTRAEIKIGFNAGNSIFNIGIGQSFSEKPKTTNLLDANGLNSGSTLTIAWQKMLGNYIVPSSQPIVDIPTYTTIKNEYKVKNGLAPGTSVDFDDFNTEFRNKLLSSGAVDLRAFKTPWFFTFQFSASRVSFDYITDALATAPLSSKEINKNFTFSFSKYSSLDLYYSAAYIAKYTYNSGDEIISYSFPVGNSGVSYAKDVTVGTPVEKFESIVKGEIRQLFRNNEFAPILSINPSISLLVRNEKINLDLPVYFLTKNSDGLFNGLQAGFKVGYTSKLDESFLKDLGDFSSDKMYFSLFLSKPFSVQ